MSKRNDYLNALKQEQRLNGINKRCLFTVSTHPCAFGMNILCLQFYPKPKKKKT